jgi:arylsulfatase A
LGGKSTPFEGGLKVPFIAKWPGKIKPSVSEQRIIGMDIYPTILSAAGLPLRPKQHVDGVNLMPVLTQNKPLEPRSLLFHFPHYTSLTGPFTAIIDNDWRLIRFYNDIKGSPYLLYHLKNDPEEQHNLAMENPEVQQQLESQMDDALLEMDAEMPTPNPDYVSGLTTKEYDSEYALKKALRQRRSDESRLKK